MGNKQESLSTDSSGTPISRSSRAFVFVDRRVSFSILAADKDARSSGSSTGLSIAGG